MNISIYKISFFQSTFDLNEEYDRLSDIDKERISEIDAEGFFDFEEGGRYISYIITSPIQIKKYLSILVDNLISFEYDDISEDVLKFKIDLIQSLNGKVSQTDSIKFSFFQDDVERWIIQNLDIDMILDRISEVGMDSLTTTEKYFLENYKQKI